MFEKRRKTIANRSEEKNKKVHEKLSKKAKLFHENMNNEKYINYCRKIKKSVIQFYNKRTNDQKIKKSYKIKKSLTKIKRTEEEKQKIILKCKQSWYKKSPKEKEIIIKKRIKGIKKSWTLERRKQQSKLTCNMIKNNKLFNINSYRGIYAEYKNTGIMMRSSWERKLASRLDNINIKWEYEKIIKHKDNYCLPDFYIPKLNIIIEVKPTKFIDERLIKKIKIYKKIGYKVFIITEKNWSKTILKIESLYR